MALTKEQQSIYNQLLYYPEVLETIRLISKDEEGERILGLRYRIEQHKKYNFLLKRLNQNSEGQAVLEKILAKLEKSHLDPRAKLYTFIETAEKIMQSQEFKSDLVRWKQGYQRTACLFVCAVSFEATSILISSILLLAAIGAHASVMAIALPSMLFGISMVLFLVGLQFMGQASENLRMISRGINELENKEMTASSDNANSFFFSTNAAKDVQDYFATSSLCV